MKGTTDSEVGRGLWSMATSSRILLHEPYHGPCEGPQIVKVHIILTWDEVLRPGLLDGLHIRHHDPLSGPQTVKALVVLT